MLVDKMTLIQNYNQLRAEWSSSCRGAGGANAIKGFDFQLLSAIKRMVQVNPSGTSVATEEISDISELHLDSIVITQAKYCISSGTVTSALNELWEIYNLILLKYPELKDCIEFNILGQWRKLNNVKSSINKWKIRNAIDTNESDIDTFIKKVSAKVESNPYEEIIQILIEDYSVAHPWSVVAGWLGELYSAISNGTVEQSCGRIRNELCAFKNNKRLKADELSFYFWKEGESPPNNVIRQTDLRKACLVGETPRKLDLIQGRFARRGVYNDIYETFCLWLEDSSYRLGGKLPVFWISGRSGAGKSVALLHLLSMIKEGERESIVTWFGDKPSSFNSFFPYLDELCENHNKTFLCFDDPYMYERQDVFNKNIWILTDLAQRLTVKGLGDSIPFILCCGPDEQLDWCEENLGDDIEIEKYRLRDESSSDIEEIKEWYEQRTGLTVVQSKSADEMLLVQSLFEWSRKESLKDFARHFKKRLSDNRWEHQNTSPFEFIGSVLAVNRLYALFPKRKVNKICEADPNLAKAIYQLEKEDRHLTLTLDGDGVKLTHPHLADVLYKEWYGKDSDSQYRKNHLSDWISFVENESSGAKSSLLPLWEISKLSDPNVRGDSIIAPRINLIFNDLKDILPGLYKRHIKNDDPLSYLPVWANLNNNFQLQLNPNPLDVIGKNLVNENIGSAGFRLSCHKIIEFHNTSNSLAHNNLRQILKTGKDWRGWRYVLYDYVRKLGVNDLEDTLIEFIKNDVENPTLIKLCHYLCGISIKIDDKAQRVMECWFETCDVNVPSWVANFTDFSKRYRVNVQIAEKATSFLKQSYDHKSWSHVWEVLWLSDVGNSELKILAKYWLKLRLGKDGGWSFVWEKLAQFLPHDQELIDIGYEYLEGDNSFKSRKYVWFILKEQDGDKLRLEGVAKGWLKKTPVGHRDWIYLWAEVVKSYEKDDDVISLGREWLYQASVYHSTWVYTQTEVLKCLALNKKLHQKIILWLEFNSMADESWQYLWEKAWKFSPKNKLLIKLGMNWLRETPFSHKAWARIWEIFWDNKLFREEVSELGLSWLSNASFDEYRWQFVWSRLFRGGSNSNVLRHMAYDWLPNVSANHSGWSGVWGQLWEAEDDTQRLQVLADTWLNNDCKGKKHKNVQHVKSKLTGPVTIDDKLNELQRKWGGKIK